MKRGARGATATAVGTCLYFAVVVGVWLLLWVGADRWWIPTILAYGPRWVYLLPLVAFVPVVLVRRRWSLLMPLAVAGVVVLLPITGALCPAGLFGHGRGGTAGTHVQRGR